MGTPSPLFVARKYVSLKTEDLRTEHPQDFFGFLQKRVAFWAVGEQAECRKTQSIEGVRLVFFISVGAPADIKLPS